MEITAAFLGPHADGLFESVAAFAGAAELETLDVSEGQNEARRAIGDAIVNAARLRANPGTRIALIKGEAGSGKTHVVTMTFRKMAAVVVSEVYPAVLQLTAPVKTSEYLNWVLDALFRELSARHFPDQLNQSPLRRLANRLLEVSESEKRDEFIVSIEDTDVDRAVILAKQLAGKIRQRAIASAILSEQPPSAAFLAVILLAGFDDWSAISYLRQGYIDDQIRSLDLRPINNSGHRMAILRDLGLAAQIIGASLVLGFDQVENTVRLGDESLFAHALVQATRIVEDVVNCAITVAVLADEYDRIVGGEGAATGLPASDRDRIERESPNPVRLEPGSPDFLLNVVARRLAVLRQRARLPEAPGSLEPLPNWLVARLREARSVRLTLNEVSNFQKMALRLGRIPTEQDYTGGDKEIPPSPKDEIDFDKLWVDFMDLAPATHIRLLESTKAHLLAWWASEASREHLASDAAQVTASNLHGEFKTHVIDIRLKAHGHVIELRQLGLCEAPNRNQKLLQQVEEFLDSCTGTPAILRTKGFPKGRTAQVAPAIRRLNAIKGLKLDLSDTEWHILQRAKDFNDQHIHHPRFLGWRRDCQWLTQLMGPLQPLITLPESFATAVESAMRVVDESGPSPPTVFTANNKPKEEAITYKQLTDSPFPVIVGRANDDAPIMWDPYRAAPDALNNFSFLVTGDSGAGKTQTIRVLIDAACRQGISVCIFDFKADYCDPSFTNPLGIEVIDVRAKGLPFNPLQPPPRGPSGVQPAEHAYELAGVLSRVFKLGAIQEGLLRQAINSTYEAAGIAPREWTNPDRPKWPLFGQVLDHLRDEPKAASLLTKLSMLTDLGLFSSSAPENSFSQFIDRRISLKLSELPTDEIKAALAEIIIIQLHGYALRGEQPRRLKRMIVFDEAHRVRNSLRLEALAREGRAFGVGLVIGTQFPGDIPESMAGNLATQLFLMNNQADHRRWIVRQIYGTASGKEPKELLDKLKALKPFEGLLSNGHYPMALLRITPYFERHSIV